MSTNSNRLIGGIMIFAGIITGFTASAWPAQADFLWGLTAGLMGVGVILGQIGMIQDVQVGIEDIKKLLPTIVEKMEAMEKTLAALQARAGGQFREQS